MNKEELESKFEDCFDANTRASEGGYGPDVTDQRGMWLAFEPIISEYAKQQAIGFAQYVFQKIWGMNGMSSSPFVSNDQLYLQFIEQQTKDK